MSEEADRILVQVQRDDIQERLQELAIPTFKGQKKKQVGLGEFKGANSPLIPMVVEKTDTHWDFLLKEMQWLATDFNSERQRHVTSRKKLSNAIKSYDLTKTQRRERNLSLARNQQRRLANRLMRDVQKSWWDKLHKVISYKDKRNYELHQQKTMNRQLIKLIRKTELYNKKTLSFSNDSAIELALKRKKRRNHGVQDYTLLNQQGDIDIDDHSIHSYDTSMESDGSYRPTDDLDDDDDDESTMLAAERIEMQERHLSQYSVDPEEIQQLHDEAEMDVEVVLERLRQGEDEDGEFEQPLEEPVDDETTLQQEEALPQEMTADEELALLKQENQMSVEELRAKYVTMEQEAGDDNMETDHDSLDTQMEDAISNPSPSSHMAKLIDTEIEEKASNDGDDEFIPEEAAVDDETTMEVEEKLGADMSYEDEISLLKAENEMSIEDLRKRYLGESNETSAIDQLLDRSLEDEENDDEFEPDSNMVDDETTIEAEEKLGRDISAADEIALLQQEGAMSIEELRQTYQMPSPDKRASCETSGRSLRKRKRKPIVRDEDGAEIGKRQKSDGEDAHGELALGRLEESARTYQNTRATRPYLIQSRVKLREYQQTGLNWLVSLQSRRLNGILADEMINFNTQRRLLLTGTPLQNNLMELWSLLHFLMPYIFRSRREFSHWFANPMTGMIEGTKTANDDVITRLHGIIRPFVLRRLKKDVETQLPGKFEHIVKCQLSRRQMFIYEEYMARSSTRQAFKKGGGNFMGMMNVLMQLRKVCNHPDLFEPRSVVTSFVVRPLTFDIPSIIRNMNEEGNVLTIVSDSLLRPVWCGGCGAASYNNAMRHDPVESSELLLLEEKIEEHEVIEAEAGEIGSECHPVLWGLLKGIHRRSAQQKKENCQFLFNINRRRCAAKTSAYSDMLVKAVLIKRDSLDDSESPSAFLAMVKNQDEVAATMAETIKRFVFAVPKAGAPPPVLQSNGCVHLDAEQRDHYDLLANSLQKEVLPPFEEAYARLTSFFPDKKLVQFDAGKLQTLATLLRERKIGGHKVLIFTQMSKMLDILETFLNLNGHTYLRLDGGTSVDRRQRLMDRFNNDDKVFAMILSTRSGGTGVNLTGADTVIFYDSDWNPAQDAQAQDRAHRIGQTREVHIYRLVTEHSIEENILLKARQKRNLDIMVMDRGNFNAQENLEAASSDPLATAEMQDFYSKGGLREIIGVPTDGDDTDRSSALGDGKLSSEQIEKTMASLEDADDAEALKGARQEAADELKEFDETIEYKKDSDGEDADDNEKEVEPEKDETQELEEQIASWQENDGVDAATIEASLTSIERYGLRFREEIDPFYSLFAALHQRQLEDAKREQENEIDIDEIERQNERDEQKAFDDGDLLCTSPDPDDLIRHRDLYWREKSRLAANKLLRSMTGENWQEKTDGMTGHKYWYNIDTGEATWGMPAVIIAREEYEKAAKEGWSALPHALLVNAMSFLLPYPDRMNCSVTCSNWKSAATDISFVRHIYPVEQGAYTIETHKMERNHYRSIADVMLDALPGDTIEFADGHYWQNSDLVVDRPLRFIGDEHNPSNVVVEMSGTIQWKTKGGYFEGMLWRRPAIQSDNAAKKSTTILSVAPHANVKAIQSVFDNNELPGPVIELAGNASTLKCEQSVIQNGSTGVAVGEGARLDLNKVRDILQQIRMIMLTILHQSIISKISECGIRNNAGSVRLSHCRFERLTGSVFEGPVQKRHCCVRVDESGDEHDI